MNIRLIYPWNFYKITSINDKISYTLVSLIIHYVESLDCGNYVSDVFDANTGIWWHCDDEYINQISDLLEGVSFRESHKKQQRKKKVMVVLKKIFFCGLYQNKPSDSTQLCFFFNNSLTCPKYIVRIK